MDDSFTKDFQLLIAYIASPKTEDRSLAIVCASYAEKYLGELIQFRLPGLNHGLREKLFKPDGLLGSFIAKIDIGKSLQTIDNGLFHDLKILASIRNRFAHNLRVDSFEHADIASRVDDLWTKPWLIGGSEEAAKTLLIEFENQSRRHKFHFVGMTTCMTLHNTLNTVKATLEQHGAKN